MDQYRNSFLQAQKKASELILLKKNNYLADVRSEDVSICGGQYFAPVIHKWKLVESYRAKESEGDTATCLKQAAYTWLRGVHGGCAVFVMDKIHGITRVLYGNTNASESAFAAAVPECRMADSTWNGHAYRYNGIMVGTLSSSQFADSFVATKTGNCYTACIAVPVEDGEIWDKIRENEAMVGYLEKYKSFQRVYGNASRRIVENEVPDVVRAISILKEENRFLQQNMGKGFARGCVRFGAEDAETFKYIAGILRSTMNYSSDNQEGFEPVRIMEVGGAHWGSRECLAIPKAYISNAAFQGWVSMISWQKIDDFAQFCSMPMRSCIGFYVKNYRIDNNSVDVFPVVRPVSGDAISLGTVPNVGISAAIPMSLLYSHMFITGATRSGKTTTVKRIVKELNDRGIHALIIEAAKKEYIQLLPEIPELRILTPGTDGEQLYINPLQVEDGTLIENHIDAVVRAITAATAGEHPIPEALEGLLKQTYSKAGWEYGMMAYTDKAKPFPTFRDALDNIAEYIRNHAKYGPEVKQNLEGAITLRTENLYSGALGRTFSKAFGITAKELLETPTVVELADFSDSGTEFLMNILLYKLHGYAARLAESRTLKRIIVVEEAHNVFRNTISEDSGRARNNEYFEKMLAEISSSGTGMILCDQRPSIMSDAVMANTSVKIAHSLSSATDRDIMAAALRLSDAQKDRLGELICGKCLVGLRGSFGVQYSSVEPLREKDSLNPACHICSCRFRCRATAVEKLLQSMDDATIRYHISKIQTNPYNTAVLADNINRMLKDFNVSAAEQTKRCLLGKLLQRYGNTSYQEKRVIINSYSNYLKGGKLS